MITIQPIRGIGEVVEGDNVGALVVEAMRGHQVAPQPGDVLVVTSKLLSKAEGRRLKLPTEVGEEARLLSEETRLEVAHVQLILDNSTRVIRSGPGVLVTETPHGLICANAGLDRSNAGEDGTVLALPVDPDVSAAGIRQAVKDVFDVDVAVLISDTFGRPFRLGQVNVAIGVSGMEAMRDYRGQRDSDGHELQGTEIAITDELCAAAELVMNKLDRVPAALVRGYQHKAAEGSGKDLLRDPQLDIFR